MNKPPKTIEEVRNEFVRSGVSVTEWARANHFHRMTVVDVLRGRRQGLRGEAHKVAVALGIKQGDVVDVRKFKPPLKQAA